MDIGQSELSSLMKVGQSLMVNAHQVQDRGLQVVDMDRLVDHMEPEFIGLPPGHARFGATARHPHGKGLGVVISP